MFDCSNDLNSCRFDAANKMGNSDDIANEITGRENDITGGIPRENLELKQMFRICSEYANNIVIIYLNSVQW